MVSIPLIFQPAYQFLSLLLKYVIVPFLAHDPFMVAIALAGITATALVFVWHD